MKTIETKKSNKDKRRTRRKKGGNTTKTSISNNKKTKRSERPSALNAAAKGEYLAKRGLPYPVKSIGRAFSKYPVENLEPMSVKELKNIYLDWRKDEAQQRKTQREVKRKIGNPSSRKSVNEKEWSNDDENLLIELVGSYGNNWDAISLVLGNHSAADAREYWDSNLKSDYGEAPKIDEGVSKRDRRTSEKGNKQTKKEKEEKEDQELVNEMISILDEEEEIEKSHAGITDTPMKKRMKYSDEIYIGPNIPKDLFGSREKIINERATIFSPPQLMTEKREKNKKEMKMLEEMDEIIPYEINYET